MKPTKYRAIRTTIDGVTFASRKEARRYSELKLLERAGKIIGLELQPRFPLFVHGRKIGTYVADFTYQENGQRVTEDAKGVRTPAYILKKKLFEAIFAPATITEV